MDPQQTHMNNTSLTFKTLSTDKSSNTTAGRRKNSRKTPNEGERFSANIYDLSNLLRELIQDLYKQNKITLNPLIVGLIGQFIKGYDNIKIMESFVYYSSENWNQIKAKNEDFFFENADEIFADLETIIKNSSKHVKAFKTLFSLKKQNGEHEVCQDDRDAIWAYFNSLVKISIKYLHKIKGPTWVHDGTKWRKAYNNSFESDRRYLADVKISGKKGHAKIWGIKLTWPNKPTMKT